MNKVLIVGSDHHNTLVIIESLAQKDIHPYVIIYSHIKKAYVLHSKFIEKGWICSDANEIVNCMLTQFSNKKDKTIVISSSDYVSDVLDKNYEKLKDYFYLPISGEYGTLADKMDKQHMTNLANVVGLHIPKTWVLTDASIPKDIEYPCITKAISSLEGTKDNIAICHTEKELTDFLVQKRQCPIIQIQRFVDKAYEFQFLGCSFDDGNEVLISGRTNIDRPNGIDNTFFLSFDNIEGEFADTVAKAKEFVRRNKYNGPFSIEFLKGKDGKDYFTEMNFRNDGNAYCQTAAGINIPYIIYLYYTQQDYKTEIESSKIHKVYLMPEIAYLRRVVAREISISEYIHNLRKADCYTTYFKNDKILFLHFLHNEFRSVITNKIKRLVGIVK